MSEEISDSLARRVKMFCEHQKEKKEKERDCRGIGPINSVFQELLLEFMNEMFLSRGNKNIDQKTLVYSVYDKDVHLKEILVWLKDKYEQSLKLGDTIFNIRRLSCDALRQEPYEYVNVPNFREKNLEKWEMTYTIKVYPYIDDKSYDNEDRYIYDSHTRSIEFVYVTGEPYSVYHVNEKGIRPHRRGYRYDDGLYRQLNSFDRAFVKNLTELYNTRIFSIAANRAEFY